MIDLHCHSSVSDGEYSPAELLRIAEDNGVSALALTDHDTTDGMEEFLAADSPVERIPGVELSCSFKGCNKVHVVGLYVDWRHQGLQEVLGQIRQWRDERNVAIVEKLKELGMPLDLAEIEALAGACNGNGVQNTVGRPHIANALCRHGFCKTKEEAFRKYLGFGRSAYVYRQTLDAKEGIDLLHKAGATVMLAHPFTTFTRHNKVAAAVRQLKYLGLDGLETIYSEYKPEDVSYGRELARNRGLLESGGSDFHGPKTTGNVQIGIGHPDRPICVPDSFLGAIQDTRRRAS